MKSIFLPMMAQTSTLSSCQSGVRSLSVFIQADAPPQPLSTHS